MASFAYLEPSEIATLRAAVPTLNPIAGLRDFANVVTAAVEALSSFRSLAEVKREMADKTQSQEDDETEDKIEEGGRVSEDEWKQPWDDVHGRGCH